MIPRSCTNCIKLWYPGVETRCPECEKEVVCAICATVFTVEEAQTHIICEVCRHNEKEKEEAENVRENAGRKDDSGKWRMSLVPIPSLIEIIRVLEVGAERYGKDNWQGVDNARERYYNAAHRHLAAWWAGERLDPDDDLSHLAHAGCCLLFLLWFDLSEKREKGETE